MAQTATIPIANERTEARSSGYITDVPYIRGFIASVAPALLDHVAVVCGFAPPQREGNFTYCDLGCGQGMTTAVLAATHPKGEFHGIDLMTDHIDHARRFSAEAGVTNTTFHAADFRTATTLGLPRFDYIVCHGVYAWVNAGVQADVRRFIDLQLKPGGLVYLSYNAFPGWATDLPLQHLLRTVSQEFSGDSKERVTSSLELVRAMLEDKVPSLVDSFVLKELSKRSKDYSPLYLAHEYMQPNWRPLFVTEVRAAMSEIDLAPVGSTNLMENFDSFVLGAKARERLSAIADANVRELVRDYYIDQHFRRDVFTRENRRLAQDEQRPRLLNSTFSLRKPADKIEFARQTPAGRLSFDNEAARAIVAALTKGPRALGDIAQESKLDSQDIVANALTLCAAGILVPVESSPVSVAKLNNAIFARLDGPEPIHLMALPCGTALSIHPSTLRRLRDGDTSPEKTDGDGQSSEKIDFETLRAFLHSQGIC